MFGFIWGENAMLLFVSGIFLLLFWTKNSKFFYFILEKNVFSESCTKRDCTPLGGIPGGENYAFYHPGGTKNGWKWPKMEKIVVDKSAFSESCQKHDFGSKNYKKAHFNRPKMKRKKAILECVGAVQSQTCVNWSLKLPFLGYFPLRHDLAV